MINLLNNVKLFQGIPNKKLAQIAKFSEEIILSDGDIIFSEGEKDDGAIYITVSGNLEVFSTTSTGQGQTRELLYMYSKHVVIGEIGWILKEPRTASMRVRGDTAVLIKIDGNLLDGYLEANPDVGYLISRRLMNDLASKLKNNNVMMKMFYSSSALF